MDKIKITVEQEKEFKEYISLENETSDIESYIHDYGHFNVLKKHFPNLSKVKPEQFALLLCGWYEVEQEFKVGDWVYSKFDKSYYKVSEKMVGDERYLSINFVNAGANRFERVTEQWKTMLLELGREKPEFVVDDVCIAEDGCYCRFWDKNSTDFFNRSFIENKIKYFYPVENRIEVNNND